MRVVSQQWAALGVFLRTDEPPDAVVDPESLLWCTLEIGRYDARLFDEVVDWLEVNHHRINVRRLRRLGPEQDDVRWRILSSIAVRLYRKARAIRWQKLATDEKFQGQPLLTKTPLFIEPSGKIVPIPSQNDLDFAERGLVRGILETRGQSRQPPLIIPASLLLRARAFFGNKADAEVWTLLLAKIEVFQSFVAERTGYSKVGVGRVLGKFVESGICREERRATAKCYSLVDREAWRKNFGLRFFPPWPDWSAIFRGLIHLHRTCVRLNRKGVSQYIFASEIRKTFTQVKKNLSSLELKITSPDPDNFLVDEFISALEKYLQELFEKSLFPRQGE